MEKLFIVRYGGWSCFYFICLKDCEDGYGYVLGKFWLFKVFRGIGVECKLGGYLEKSI